MYLVQQLVRTLKASVLFYSRSMLFVFVAVSSNARRITCRQVDESSSYPVIRASAECPTPPPVADDRTCECEKQNRRCLASHHSINQSQFIVAN